ncbi:Suox, partial [Symbiodinium microadriaticum]
MSALEGTAGTPWTVTALSNARWEGALLSDVLRYCGVRNATIRKPESAWDDMECSQEDFERAGMGHVEFMGMDDMNASIPMGKAMQRDGDVLLAYRMNGEDVQPEEAEGTWQRGMAYKGFNPSRKSTAGLDVAKILSLQEQPVQSAITVPPPNFAVTAGSVLTVKGYAYSGGGRGIVRVDVSIDGGKTWQEAELTEGSEQPMHRAWAWTFWECDVQIPETVDKDGPCT